MTALEWAKGLTIAAGVATLLWMLAVPSASSSKTYWDERRAAYQKACAVSYTHLTLPTKPMMCRSRWSPYH